MMERFPHKTEDAIARLRRKIECLRKMYALGDPISSDFFRNAISVSVMRSEINHHTTQGLERSAIAEVPPRPSSFPVPNVMIGEVSEALCGTGVDHLVLLASRTRKRKSEDASSILEARAQRPSVIQATPFLKDEFEAVGETTEPSREGETINESAEKASNANETSGSQNSQISEFDRSHQGKMPAGKQSIPIDQAGDLSVFRKTVENGKLLACDAPKKRYSYASDLARQQRTHTAEKSFPDDVCDKSFIASENSKACTRRKPFSCDLCEKKFESRSSLTVHQRTHTGEKPFPCDVCGKEFNVAVDLTKHRRIHTGAKPFTCDVCDKSFNQSQNLKTHRRIHTGEKPFSCDVCGNEFKTRSSLTKHRRVHTGEKPFPCDVCGKSFAHSDNLKIHRRIHTGEKPFPCDVCGKKFNVAANLVTHRRIHTGEKPFTCDVCDNSFNHLQNLKIHRRIHTGERPFCCDNCDKKFNDSSSLRKHKRIHTGEKPFSCDVCGKSFTQSGHLKVHRRTHTDQGPIARDVSHGSTNF